MTDNLDPEVLADLRLREQSLRDPTRTAKEPVWIPPVIVERVPCRGRCGAVTEWTEEAQHAFETFNRKLESDDQAPLDKTRIAFCDTCKRQGIKLAADDKRKHVDLLAGLIRELKNGTGSDADVERDLVERIRKLRHPDVEGLVEAIRRRREVKPQRQTRGMLE